MATSKPLLTNYWANSPAVGDVEAPDGAKYGTGWLFGEKPPHKWMNYLQQTTTQAFAHLNERGVLEWDIATPYLIGAMVSSGGKVYKARQANTGQAVTLTSFWQEQSLPDMPTAGDGYILYYSGAKLYWKDEKDVTFGDYEGRVISTEKYIKFSANNTINNAPLASEIGEGELVINYKDKAVYTKTPEGDVISVAGQASIVDHEFTVLADGEDTFSPLGGYVVNQIEVFINGRKQAKADYTANNSVDVVFNTPLTKDDFVVVSVWASFAVSDAYTQAQVDAIVNTALTTLKADRAGITFDFAGAVAPSGSLECNGQVVLKADYPELYSAIGDLWATTGGAGSPLTTEFRLPPQAIGGIGLFTRGKGAVGIGVYQADVFKAHNHTGTTDTAGNHRHSDTRSATTSTNAGDNTVGSDNNNGTIYGGYAGDHSHILTIDNTGDATETRPRSITMMKCIWTGK